MHKPVITNRAQPYCGPGTKLIVPPEIWEQTLTTLRQYGALRAEGLVFWGGMVSAAGAFVTGLYRPRHIPQGARAALTPEETRWLLRKLRERDEKLLAQVHSHPGEAYHSPGDDDHATSFHPGFLSIVVSNFARRADSIENCAVFEFDDGAFHRLDGRAVQTQIQVRSLIEERVGDVLPKVKSSWLHTIASKLTQKLIGPKRR